MNLKGWQPRNDRVIIERLDAVTSGLIKLTDQPKGLKGRIVAAGPGKWIEGTWWKVRLKPFTFDNPNAFSADGWEWIPGHREEHPLKPGMTVLFNSKWDDFRNADFEREKPTGIPENLHMVQVADVFCILGGDVSAAYSLETKARDVVPTPEQIVAHSAPAIKALSRARGFLHPING